MCYAIGKSSDNASGGKSQRRIIIEALVRSVTRSSPDSPNGQSQNLNKVINILRTSFGFSVSKSRCMLIIITKQQVRFENLFDLRFFGLIFCPKIGFRHDENA